MHKKGMPAWLVLTLITLVAAVLLGATYEMTKDAIHTQTLEKAASTRRELLPTASVFDKLENEALSSLYEGKDENGETVGYVATTTVVGFGGDVEIIVGLDPDGVLTGISVGGANFAETPGLGAKAKEPAFTNQFAGLTVPVALHEDVDSITSATITSNAVVRGVNSAADEVGKIAGFSASAPANVGEVSPGRFYSEVQGFAGPVYVEIAVDDQKAITEIIIGNDSFAETAGYGKKAQEPAFYEQFIGLSGTINLGEQVDAISGATITSTAVVKAVNQALAFSRGETVEAEPEAETSVTSSATGAAVEAPEADVVGQNEDGRYFASAKGFAGPVYVEIALDNAGKIAEIVIGNDQFAETPGFGAKAQEAAFCEQFIGLDGTITMGEHVDAIAGATITSNAVESAVNAALALSRGEIEAIEPKEEPVTESAPAAEGTSYSASAQGFAGPVYVELTLDAEGKITAITIGDDAFAETAGFGAKAKEPAFYEQFIGLSGAVELGKDVDAIAGATVTSEAVVKAVNEILAAVPDAEESTALSASAQGFAGPVYVELTLDAEGKIATITIGDDAFAETAGFGAKAKEPAFYEQFIGLSGAVELGKDVDAIAGATVTSEAVVKAVNEILAAVPAAESSALSASTKGFAGPVYVELTLDAEGKIAAITIGDDAFAETAGFGAKAKEPAFYEQFIGLSDTVELGKDVDAIAGATITSEAVVKAVNEILAAAPAAESSALSASTKGFAGPVYVELTLDAEGKITAITIGDDAFAETAGFGAKAKEPAFYEQFIGLSGAVELGKDVDAIAGATVTSEAVVKAVNEILAAAK